MSVAVTIVEGPLEPLTSEAAGDGTVGALVIFDGIVRAAEGDGMIEALEYDVYEPMASRELGRLAADVIRSGPLLSIRVWHSRGRVPVGACSFRLLVTAAHRKEALRAMDEFIDRMKRDAPIWKRAVYAR